MLTAGVDIGGTKLLAVAATEKGEIVAAAPPADGVRARRHPLRHRHRGEPISSPPSRPSPPSGSACPASSTSTASSTTPPTCRASSACAARELLAAACPVPVVVDNDANVAALGEVLHGAGRGRREVLVVTLGTGIGGGLVINGEVHRGGYGLAAEIGHFTVDPDGPPCACGGPGPLGGDRLGKRPRPAGPGVGRPG